MYRYFRDSLKEADVTVLGQLAVLSISVKPKTLLKS